MAKTSETLFRHLALTVAGRSTDRITNNLWFLLKLNYAFSIAEAFINSMRNGISRRSRSLSAENRFGEMNYRIDEQQTNVSVKMANKKLRGNLDHVAYAPTQRQN